MLLPSNCSTATTETKNRVLQEHFWKGHLCLKQNHCYHGKFEETRDFVLTSPRQSQPEDTSHPLPPVSTGHLQTLTAPGQCREPATDTTCAAIALIRPAPFPLPTNPYKTRSAAIISPRPCRACEKTKIFIKPGTTKNVGQIDWTFFSMKFCFNTFLLIWISNSKVTVNPEKNREMLGVGKRLD